MCEMKVACCEKRVASAAAAAAAASWRFYLCHVHVFFLLQGAAADYTCYTCCTEAQLSKQLWCVNPQNNTSSPHLCKCLHGQKPQHSQDQD